MFRQHINKSDHKVKLGHALTDEECIKQGLVLVRRIGRITYPDPTGTTYEYAAPGRSWATFCIEFETLRARISKLGLTCLIEGRALAIKETSSGNQFIHPYDWHSQSKIQTKPGSMRFVLTRALPDHWFYANLGPRQKAERMKKKQALDWLNCLFREVAPSGKKATKEDVFTQLEARFQICGVELKKDIWKEADIDAWKKGGAPGFKNKYHFDNT
jgi:hypothetical protein